VPLDPGTRLGPYEITAQIGVGGMGEVYRATDTNLKRAVAIKVIAGSVSSDPDRLARLQREAEVLASLNHPNIAHIHGVEKRHPSTGSAQAGMIALVMELVEGPTLAERIQAGPIPVDEALVIARQIAEALEAAHERGIVHRDLKPANVKVRDDGTVKVLDFGLAKAMETPSAMSSSLSLSPTITTPAMTQMGVILGTAAYMSPEQARGKPVDQRTDIWAFGCVLYEMLTGKRAFDAEDVSVTLARVLERDVDLSGLPAPVPPRLRRVIELCLRKDARQRLHAIGDVRLALDGVFETPAVVTKVEPAVAPRPLWLRLAPIAALTAVAGAAIGYLALRPAPAPQVLRFQIHAPAGSTLPLGTPAISPDGRTIAYTVTDADGMTRIHVRPLDRLDTRVLPGTENAVHPFWFADGRSLGFTTLPDNYLKQIEVGAGSPRTLFNVAGPWHGTANLEGTLLVLAGGGISRWSNGQQPVLVPRRDGDSSGAFPFFLPDGQRFLILVNATPSGSIQLARVNSPERTHVVDTVNGAALMTRTPMGKSYLLFVRNTDLLAQEFDETAGVVRGAPKVIVNDIGLVANPPLRPAVGAANGVLAFQTGGVAEVPQLIWLNRSGAEVQRLTRGASVRNPRLSGDGERLVGTRFGSGSDIWITELARGASTQITFLRNAFDPVWSPDGKKIAYRRSDGTAVIVGVDGSGERQIAKTVGRLWDWSADGRMVLAGLSGGFTMIPLDDGEKPTNIQPPNGRLRDGHFSPNSRYYAFVSDESGRDEVYVQAVPPSSFRTKISIDGGIAPRWRRDGKELFFLSPSSTLMSVDVNAGAAFSTGVPRELFKTAGGPNLAFGGYVVSRDGQQFLMPGRDSQTDTWPITVVLNWWSELE
jgi:Tol biopolymer transport system component